MKARAMTLAVCLGIGFLILPPAVSGQSAEKRAPKAGAQEGRLRWMDAYASTRFIYVDNRGGRIRMQDLQYKLQLKGRWNWTQSGSAYLQFRAETGNAFQPGWNYSGWGRNAASQSFSVKDLFLGQRIGSRLELRAGGIEFDRGLGTEATFADDDGFHVGYQVQYGPPRGWWPEKLQVTISHIGEFQHPSVFARFPGMSSPNAVQVLAEKRLAEKLEFSGEFDRIEGVEFTRLALRWAPPAFLSRVTLESLVRTADNPSVGYSLQLLRKFGTRRPCSLTFTYSHMESGLFANNATRLLLNGDQPNLGQRLALSLSRPLGRGFSATTYVSRQLDRTISVPRHDRWRTQLVLTYRFTDWLNARFHNSEKGG